MEDEGQKLEESQNKKDDSRSIEKYQKSSDNKQINMRLPEVVHYENISKTILNAQGSNSKPVMLKECRNIHIGPKIECHHHHHSRISSLLNSDLKSVDLFLMYRERLKNYYATHNAYMRSLFWDGKRKDFSLKNYFVELKMEEKDLLGKKTFRNVQLEDIFQSNERGHKTILLTGDPGFGKTTVCQKLAYDWATGIESENYLKQFYFVVVIILRHLNKKCLIDEVLYEIFRDKKEEFKTKLQEADLNVLVILDGFDEISDKKPVLNFIRDDSFEISLKMTILLTSRPYVTEEIREDTMYWFNVSGFLFEQQEKYVRVVFPDDPIKGEVITEVLQFNKFYSKLAECPLMLHMLCCLHISNSLDKIESETDLYIHMFSLIIKRYIKKNGGSKKLKNGNYFLGEDLLIRLGELAQHSSLNPVTSENLENQFPEKEEYEFILGLDILFFDCFEDDGVIQYDFVHRTFREFLSALYIYDVTKNKVFLVSVSFQTTVFIFGLANNELFHPNLLEYLNRQFYSPYNMIRIAKEIKNKDNKKTVCLTMKMVFYLDESDDLKILLKLLPYPRIYLMLYPHDDAEYLREELVKFHEDYDLHELEIRILLEQSVIVNGLVNINLETSDIEVRKSVFIDIREFATTLINLIVGIEWKKFKIYFVGRKFGDVDFFINVRKPVNISKPLQDEIKETCVFLQIKNCDDKLHNYLISEKQFEVLEPYIKIVSNLEY